MYKTRVDHYLVHVHTCTLYNVHVCMNRHVYTLYMYIVHVAVGDSSQIIQTWTLIDGLILLYAHLGDTFDSFGLQQFPGSGLVTLCQKTQLKITGSVKWVGQGAVIVM